MRSAPAAVPAIEVEELVKRYAGRAVVDGLSFGVRPGEICALLGPNGAGKTTTAEIVEGYRRPDGGSVRVLGTDPARGGPPHRARVGLMLQEGGIDPRMRPAETLRLYASFVQGGATPEELLERVGLRTVADTPYRRLSGGERQRLGLALALVGRPEVLILDEPTAGMDPEAKAATRELVADLRNDGAAVLLTTHELADVERMADRIVIIVAGRVVASGSRAEILAGTSPRLRFRVAEPLSRQDREALAAQLGGSLAVGEADAYRLEGREPTPETIATLAAWCAQRGLRIVELQTGGTPLEERYLELMRTGEG